MKTHIFILVASFFFSFKLAPQTIKGKVVDENQFGLADIDLNLYVNSNVYMANTASNGSSIFQNVTEIEEEQLPTGYAISNNFPNPFNPKTRISIKSPVCSIIKIEVFNILGQGVNKPEERYLDTDQNYIDIELNGLPSGIYIARITLDNKYNKYVVVRKMMLIYGSQHLTTNGVVSNQTPNKINNENIAIYETHLDSLVVSSTIIGRKVFTNLPSLFGDTTDLGNLVIERYCPGLPTVTYEGKIYHTIKIGDQCWLKENLDVGRIIDGSLNQSNNGTIEKYCYNNDSVNCQAYGGLYQWDELMQYSSSEATQGICPIGWHIPKQTEIVTLRTLVNNDGNALKAIGQGVWPGIGTNTSGFSGLLVGFRDGDGTFKSLGEEAGFWSSTEYIGYPYAALQWSLFYSGRYIYYSNYIKVVGFSTRCLKD